ncbi:hypothetical protein STENM223S_08422 [Streptomyces tendae]
MTATEATEDPAEARTADPAGERLRRWRLVLGGDAADGTGHALSGRDAAMDDALTALYGKNDTPRLGRERAGGLGASAPSVARWLGDIRTYFPTSSSQVMRRDAIDLLGRPAAGARDWRGRERWCSRGPVLPPIRAVSGTSTPVP